MVEPRRKLASRRAKSLFALFCVLALSSCFAEPVEKTAPKAHSNSPTTSAARNGNNEEARDFAAAMTEMSKQTWPKGQVVWNLELTPKDITGDIISYRKRVTYCNATISMNYSAWKSLTKSDQRAMVIGAMKVLHKPPVLITGDLDYYPNSSGEVDITDNIVGVAWAYGTYTRTKTSVRLLLE
jgi:hypothetical protein